MQPPQAAIQVNQKSIPIDDGRGEFIAIANESTLIESEFPGFKAKNETVSWSDLAANGFEIHITLEPETQEPAETSDEKQSSKNENTVERLPEVHEADWGLPSTLAAAPNSRIDDETGLPLTAVSTQLLAHSDMEFTLIPSGTYQVGVHGEDRFPWELEGSLFEVNQPFYIAIRESTISQYVQFFESAGTGVAGDSWKASAQKQGVAVDAGVSRSDLPVSNMSAEQAEQFCQWLGGRLPTENEWEAAYQIGNRSSTSMSNSKGLFRGRLELPRSVYSANPNESARLIYPIGNVAEWCQIDLDGDNTQTPTVDRLIKGCSFLTAFGKHARPTWRSVPDQSGDFHIGIRVVIPATDNQTK